MYQLRFKESVTKDFKKIGRPESERILKTIHEKLLLSPNTAGIPLKGNDGTLWRFRVGDYRVIYTFDGGELVVLVISVAHRKDIYRK